LERQFTHPPELRGEMEALVGDYILHASTADTNFRQMDRDAVLERIYHMDRQRFELTKHFIQVKDCDLIFTVTMGTDRMPYLYFRYMDQEHVRHVPNTKYAMAMQDYYRFCDAQIGEIVEAMDDDTAIMVLSDHSVQRLDGRINLNDWLIQEGYLVLKQDPGEIVPLRRAEVDWASSVAWATGYTGQLYLNVKGREAQGVVRPEEYDALLDELGQKIAAIPSPEGQELATRVIKRSEVYSGPQAQYAPDLFIYFDDLRWNISEGIGHEGLYSYDTVLGEDDGGHGPYGTFILAGPGVEARGRIDDFSLLDVAPTIVDLMGVEMPSHNGGTFPLAEGWLSV
jgi:predicted AlkP superfamily phosphohydrolase/phosphomutase